MNKNIFSIVIISLLMVTSAIAQNSFYDYSVKDINGNDFPFSQLKGKKVMIVNTASKCGYTPQYADLQKIYDEYGGDDFVIIGFPANNFAKQEPGSNESIKDFCERNYGVSFPMMSKISVKGNDIAPIYQWLTSKEKNGKMDSEVDWNFQKYLIDEKGQLVSVFKSKVKPDSEEIIAFIEK